MSNVAHLRTISNSLLVWVFLAIALLTFRIVNVAKDEISWDVLGYYLPLPAIFIYDDPMLDRTDWIENINQKKKLSSTLYQISSTPEGRPMYFFLFGMAICYLPFFLIAHGIALLFGFPPDGFSFPYQSVLAIGCVLYTLIGLWYLRKILLEFFSEKVTSLVLVVIVVGTNYCHHLTLKNLETVNLLFMCCSALIWHTIKWQENQKFRDLMVVGLSIVFAALIKPSEILLVLIPVFWGFHSRKSILEKLQLVWKFRLQIICVSALCALLCIPQIFYWYLKTGKPLYDSYKNPGVGLDFLSPHICETLFSYRKGWLLYTPIMGFALLGFLSMAFGQRKILIGILLPFLAFFWLVSSWSEWWYGAGFSIRPLIAYYPLLAIPMGSIFSLILEKGNIWKYVLFFLLTIFICFNQFQWWQLRHYILDPYRTTKEYYWATFLSTNVSQKDKSLLMIDRSSWGDPVFRNRKEYRTKKWIDTDFHEKKQGQLSSMASEEFAYTHRIPYQTITPKDHIWIRVSFVYRTSNADALVFAMMMDRREGAYGYKAWDLPVADNWKKVEFFYLTPEIRSIKDHLKFDFWKKTPSDLFLDEFQMEVYEKRN